ncbi:aminoacyl-tRNA hydrolase [Emticicia sp. CRIBPO]|uniref:aminoacyl-tRNA hydrolase n=1 Tax=Emticicia sp. CRIBPO TaxID=2683258 RepID=UPI00141350F7|nr:aminoacyl-tRNA hydrolase [Emticicia sp. CRIBPO]NBA86285.1 aminoacyl-tRNA hydrolase [Emticicia sp. CRIBPO]
MKYLIVGLGNIGPKYAFTRHNAGFMVLDRLAAREGLTFKIEKLASVAEFKHKGRSITLIKPTTFMNLSGKALNYWMQQLQVPIENVMVIVDDLALPFGKLRIKPKGSSAGHNGLKDIEAVLGNNLYPRLKFGIGDDFPKGRQVDYVLDNFNEDEMAGLIDRLDKAIEMVLSFCTIGIERTMNFLNE